MYSKMRHRKTWKIDVVDKDAAVCLIGFVSLLLWWDPHVKKPLKSQGQRGEEVDETPSEDQTLMTRASLSQLL